ncbi:uncharacterized protein CIMG_05584 [Coccidioides immitis RS]|uniref:Uncharacterized protein n=1 Tax=Coccidioides immitis (strain RS) TaxID=246410 RepID=A0A0D8JY66_COCIM|nr:uncharacterized protein CIMG_05584 [Coccidioides immitis RS]KJF61193.1 hypothetical protein CIMG_05584 [Coccidioides immitis RS]
MGYIVWARAGEAREMGGQRSRSGSRQRYICLSNICLLLHVLSGQRQDGRGCQRERAESRARGLGEASHVTFILLERCQLVEEKRDRRTNTTTKKEKVKQGENEVCPSRVRVHSPSLVLCDGGTPNRTEREREREREREGEIEQEERAETEDKRNNIHSEKANGPPGQPDLRTAGASNKSGRKLWIRVQRTTMKLAVDSGLKPAAAATDGQTSG